MIIKVNTLRGLTFPSTPYLYAYLVDLVIKGIDSLSDEDFEVQLSKWKVLSQNFNLTKEEMIDTRKEVKNALWESKDLIEESLKGNSVDSLDNLLILLSRTWINTIMSVFFIVEPDIIDNNFKQVNELWEFFFRIQAKYNNAINYLNIMKI